MKGYDKLLPFIFLQAQYCLLLEVPKLKICQFLYCSKNKLQLIDCICILAMNQPKNNIQSGINARNWYSHQKIRLEPDNRLSLAQILRVKSFTEIIKILPGTDFLALWALLISQVLKCIWLKNTNAKIE